MKLFSAKCVRIGRMLWTIPAIALLFSVPGLAAQSQNNQKESLGEAARKARQQKKPAAKPVKVLTDDDLARLPEKAVQSATATEARIPGEAPAAEGQEQPAPAESPEGQAPPSTPAEASGEAEQRRAGLEGDLKALKQQLDEAERELNLLQREFDLRRDQYYSNPDFKSDKQGKARLDALQQQINVRQQEVERLKEKSASLEAERKTLPAAPASTEKPATPPQP